MIWPTAASVAVSGSRNGSARGNRQWTQTTAPSRASANRPAPVSVSHSTTWRLARASNTSPVASSATGNSSSTSGARRPTCVAMF
jgi:hypothetical protein